MRKESSVDPVNTTPWSTVKDQISSVPTWAGKYDGERIAAYKAYQDMYFSEQDAFELIKRNEDGSSLYIPKPKMIVDTTAHYLMKGMRVGVADPKKNVELQTVIDTFCKRERFYSRFEVAKLAGVIRGDYVFHLTADPTKEEGSRLSLNSVDPAAYFPEFDTDDLEKRTGAKLVQMEAHPDDDTKTVVRVLRYWHEYDDLGVKTSPLVWRTEVVMEMEGWNNPEKAKVVKTVIAPSTLPTDITVIPLYHFKNAEFDGFEFGNSELKGYERIFQGINQAMSDVEISLALVGLGVYATDAGRPKDSQGREVDWIVSPGTVWEMPGATMVKRLEGISSVTPVKDFVDLLSDSLLGASGTSSVALGDVEVDVAESGIALALKFQPTLAKIEYRDKAGVEVLTQMWYDWKFWWKAYESQDFTAIDIIITLGDKLPINRSKSIEELNNLLDRGIISKQYYRDQLTLLFGMIFPETIAQDIIDEKVTEAKAMLEVAQEQMGTGEDDPNIEGPGGRKVGSGDTLPAKENQSNNKAKVNESKGTEIKK